MRAFITLMVAMTAISASIPNCVDLSPSVKIDQTEVTVSSYFFYWSDNQRADGLAPDDDIFLKAYQVSFTDVDPESEVFNSPMVGLSKAQCVQYCAWRSGKVNQTLKNGKVAFRLPTVKELQDAGKLQASVDKKTNAAKRPHAYSRVKSKKLYGIQSNVAEYTSGEKTFDGSVPFTGFRCVADIIE